eukprot:3662877-Rhodomonas_salina.1
MEVERTEHQRHPPPDVESAQRLRVNICPWSVVKEPVSPPLLTEPRKLSSRNVQPHIPAQIGCTWTIRPLSPPSAAP